MKEKKTIACVVLGAALVSLISVLVVALANSLIVFIDGNRIYGEYIGDKCTGGLILGLVALGAAFVAVFFANKKARFAVNLGLTIAIIVYCIVTIVELRVKVNAVYKELLSSTQYAVMTSYLTSALTLAVSASLMFVAQTYLSAIKKKELQAAETNEEVSQA